MNNIYIYNIEDYLPQYFHNNGEVKLTNNGFETIVETLQTDLFEEIEQSIKDEIYNDELDNESDKCPEWVTKKNKLGAFGEKLALNYLNSLNLNPQQVSTISSSYGYDILIRDGDVEIVYEVKTTSRVEDKFYISYNELKVASGLGDQYNIFYIHVDPQNHNIYGYIIQNPIETLNINIRKITEIFENSVIQMMPSSFIIQLKQDAISEMESINMLAYIEK